MPWFVEGEAGKDGPTIVKRVNANNAALIEGGENGNGIAEEDDEDDGMGRGMEAQFNRALQSVHPFVPLTKDDVKLVRLNDVEFDSDTMPMFFFHDVTGYVDLLDSLTDSLTLPCFGIQLPDFDCLHGVRSIEELVSVYVEALMTIQPEPPYVLSGFGVGCQLAYEAAVQMGPQLVSAVIFLDGQVTKEKGYHHDAIWYGLYTLVSDRITVTKFVKEMQRRRRFEDQLQYMLTFCPEEIDVKRWDQTVNEQLCKTHFCAMASEIYEPETFYNGTAYLFASLWSPDAGSQEIDSRSFMIKLICKKHRGLDAKHALETAEKIELAICESLEIWERMTEEGCHDIVVETFNTMRHIPKLPTNKNDPPYVNKWVQEDLPISTDVAWDEVSSNSSMFEADWNQADEHEGRVARQVDIMKSVNWDFVEKRLAELRSKGRKGKEKKADPKE